MNRKVLFAGSSAIVSVLVLASCGGGSSSPAPAPTPPPPPAQVTISGTATYDSVPPLASLLAGLNYAGTVQKPIRLAAVDILDAASNVVLASTVTNLNGGYQATFATGGATQAIVRVKASSTRTTALPAWDFSVRDNTSNGALYVLDASPLALTASSLTLNLRAASGWTGSNSTGSYTGTRSAAPFAILDTVYNAVAATMPSAPAQTWPQLQLFWSVNNVPSGNDPTTGQIGTTYYAGPNGGVQQIYILGDADVDTDEYDSHVIAHEWGHYFQNVVSRDDSTGGPHAGGDSLDMRIAFSEGWGDGWSGIALSNPVYQDSNGAGQQSGFGFDVSVAPSLPPMGWFSEDSISYLFWTLKQQLNFGPIYNAMINVGTNDAATSIFSFAAALRVAAPSSVAAINSTLAGQGVSGTDAYGAGETNFGDNPSVLPVYNAYGSLGSTQQLCINDTDGIPNKLGNFAYTVVTLPSGDHTVTVTGGGDPDFELFNHSVYLTGFSSNPGSETQTFVGMAAGSYVLSVTDFVLSGPTCLDVVVQ